MTKSAAISQADLTRVFKAAKAAGMQARVVLDPGGKMVIMAEPHESLTITGSPIEDTRLNPWDKDLE